MAKSYYSLSRLLTPISAHLPQTKSHGRNRTVPICSQFRTQSSSLSSNKDAVPQYSRKKLRKVSKQPRRLITISTSGGGWQGQWSCDYVLTLRELQLGDLAEDGQDAEVFVSLSIQKHTSFGFSIDGRIITAFNRKCSCCYSSYCREIDTTFSVWVLPSSKSNEDQLAEIGGSDPSVIYVKPGSEADLDSLIQDTIRLTASAKDICSKSCEKPTVIWQYTDEKRSYDQRWSRLLELKNAM